MDASLYLTDKKSLITENDGASSPAGIDNRGCILNYNFEPIATFKISYCPSNLKIIFELYLKTNDRSVYLHNKLVNTNKCLFGNILCHEIGKAVPVGDGKRILRYIKIQEQSPSIDSMDGICEDILSEASYILRRQWHLSDFNKSLKGDRYV